MSPSQQLTIEQAISQAEKAARQGNVAVARQLYNAILRHQSNHPIATQGLRKLQQELPYHQLLPAQMADPSPDQINALINLYHSGQMTKAEQACKELMQTYPESLTVLNVLGAALAGQGQFQQAVQVFDNMIQLKPNLAEAYINRGVALKKLGQLEAAAADYEKAIRLKRNLAETYIDRGNTLTELGQLEVAAANYEKAIRLKLDLAETYINRGNALTELGQLEVAAANYEKVIQLKPDSAEAYNNRGNALTELGRPEAAVESYSKAIELKPNLVEAYSGRGDALTELGQLEAAMDSYDQAIELQPDYAEAYINRSDALTKLGQLEAAVDSCNRAIQIQPDYAEAYINHGNALQELGRLGEAVENYRKAISIAPQNGLFWADYAECLQSMKPTSCGNDFVHDLLQMLEQPTVSPHGLSETVISALRYYPKFLRILELFKSNHADKDIDHLTVQLSTIPLLLRVMELSPIADLDVERMFSKMRASMLTRVTSGRGEAQGLPFYAALTIHCFTNEYVFSESEEEKQKIELLQEEVKSTLEKGKPVPPTRIAVLGAYRPLSSFSWADDLLRFKWPNDMKKVIIAQVNDVREEQALRPNIPRLTARENKVSQAVRNQYEENPYPRWIKTGLRDKPKTIIQVLQAIKIHHNLEAQQFSNEPDILVAGCGTGQHALITASRFLNCNVLAMDLSLSSLSYAMRKTQELGITNIEYMQGDILKLDQLERQFDIIESVGVLHHMDDPLAGWKVLVDRLRSDGLMKIGLCIVI